jgi:hypothetical protein
LEKELGWRRYGGKHYESIFTRFYQGYILPNKFGVDKRKLHYSTLIISGQISREQALLEIKGLAYPSLVDLESDTKYFLKKMNWNAYQLGNYLERFEVSHSTFLSEKKYLENFLNLSYKIRKLFCFFQLKK